MPAELLVLLLLAAAIVIAALAIVVQRLRAQNRQLHGEARIDPLTGLPNRRQLAAAWQRLPEAPAVLFLDLVGFRAVNDGHGHLVGDQLLRQVATRLAGAVAAPELLARWGGDEFVAVVRRRQAAARLGQLMAALQAPFDLSADGGPACIRISARGSESGDQPSLDRALATAALALPGIAVPVPANDGFTAAGDTVPPAGAAALAPPDLRQ